MNKILIYLALLLTSFASFADYSGNTCVDYIGELSKDDFNYLRQKTLYGYVLGFMNMRQVDSCASSSSELKVCIKKTGSTNWSDCTPYTFSKGSSTLISSLDNESLKIDLLTNLKLNVALIEEVNKLCLTMDSIYGQMPLVCKSAAATQKGPSYQDEPLDYCRPKACAVNVTSSNSQLLFNFSGRMMQCVRESLDGMFFENPLCAENSKLNSFSTVTNYLRKIIFTMLAIYTIFYGIKILMDPYKFELEKAIVFIIKMLMVVYFTVGFEFTSIFASKVTQQPKNGIIDVALPLFRSISTDLSQIVLGAARSNSQGPGLCQFDPQSYPKGYSYFAMFDAIDCRIGYFLGYGMLYDSFKDPSTKSESFPADGFLIFKAILGLLFSSPVLAILNALFVYLFLQTLLVRFIGVFMFYTVSLYAMFFISPIFIPMALFDQTKQMFKGWLKVTLSFALQPAIIAICMTIMFLMYDKSLYGNCTFSRYTYPYKNSKITTFQPTLPNFDSSACSESYGYQLYELYSGKSWSTKTYPLFKVPVAIPNGDFFPSVLKALIISFVISQFATSVQEIAAELTGGASLGLNDESGGASHKNDGGKEKGDKGDDKGKVGKGDDKGKADKGGDKAKGSGASGKSGAPPRAGPSK
jgi:type IV secretion system protein VirB6